MDWLRNFRRKYLDGKTVVSLLIGSSLSLAMSFFFYYASGNDLAAEAGKLKNVNVAMAAALTNLQNKNVRFTFSTDKDGNPSIVNAEVKVESVSSESALSGGTATAIK